MTTRPCETRAASPSGCAARNARICAACSSAKSSDSPARTTLLVRKFMPAAPAQRAEARLPPPYHMRETRPGECGCTRSDHSSTTPSRPADEGGPPAAADRGPPPPADESHQPLAPPVGEVLDLGGVGVERPPDVVPVHRRADADAGVEPPAGEDGDRGEVLGQPQGVLPAERDDRRAQLDAGGPLGGRGQDGDRRGDPVLQVPVAHPRAVEAEALAEGDHLQRRLVAGTRVGVVEQADGEEAELLQRGRGVGHGPAQLPPLARYSGPGQPLLPGIEVPVTGGLPMSTVLSHRGRALLVVGAAAGLVAVPAIAAAADPPGLDPPTCASTLARVDAWPGSIPTPDGPVHVFSDAYDSYLSQLPVCSDEA